MSHPPILRLGSQGSDVERLQQYLSAFGYDIKTDGDFGKHTETALRKFQQQYSLSVDGVVGPETGRQLNMAFMNLKA